MGAMMNWYMKVLRNYVGFSGRARRAEFWYFALFNLIFAVILTVLDRVLGLAGENGLGPLYVIYLLAIILPSLAVEFRRLHDTDRSAWWILIAFVPIVGFIVLIVFFCQKGTAGQNKYGPDPLAAG
jgi:uncharacterized membrane protein YhaH (DUF805 family)